MAGKVSDVKNLAEEPFKASLKIPFCRGVLALKKVVSWAWEAEGILPGCLIFLITELH